MSELIKPIPTRYKGYHFRSRLEARWAVFLDHIGAEWTYEEEGFELPDGTRYLPDFKLPGLLAFLEIKPPAPKLTDLIRAQTALAALIEDNRARAGLIALGEPSADTNMADGLVLMRHGGPHLVVDLPPIAGVITEVLMRDTPPSVRNAALRSAVDAAKSARFEFGESGAT